MKKYLLIIIVPFILFSCSESSNKDSTAKDKLLVQIMESEKVMYNDTVSDLNVSVANNAITLYSRYANEYPDDSSSAEYLFRAAELSKALNKGKMALNYYEKVENEYPTYSKMPIVIFMQGFVNETLLSDYKTAKSHYERFIAKYPQNPMSKDLKTMILNLGKSDEELIKEFKAKESNTNS